MIYANPTKDAKGELEPGELRPRRLAGDRRPDAPRRGSLDPDEARLINQADKLIWDEVHSLTLYQRPQITGVNKTLANVGSFGFEQPDYKDIGFVK